MLINSFLGTLSLLSMFIFSHDPFFRGDPRMIGLGDSDISDNTSSYSPSVNKHLEWLS